MRVADWMQRKLITINPQETLRTAWQLLRQHHIRHLPVVEEGRLIGIVTDRDLRQAMPYLLDKVHIREVMTKRVVGVSLDVSIAKAADLMLRNKIGCLPVLEGEVLVGIITESDILRAVAEQKGILALPEVPLLQGKE